MTTTQTTKNHRPIGTLLGTGIWILSGVICIRIFYDISTFYSDFKIIYGLGVQSIHSKELVYWLNFLFFGSLGMCGLAVGLYRTRLPSRLRKWAEPLFERQRTTVIVLAALVFAAAALFRSHVLMNAPITDDESTYEFIAETLLQGRLVNPVPSDPDFYANQFIVINDHGWYGKYPVGHPAVLALGLALGIRNLFPPFITALSLLVTFLIGERIFGKKAAVIAVVLLLLSPHFVWTGATLLSQTTTTLLMLLGLWATIRFDETHRMGWGWAAGAALTWGVVARPMPGALFLIVLFGVVALPSKGAPYITQFKTNLKYLIPVAVVAACGAALMLYVNVQQTGEPFKTGYHEVHGDDIGVGVQHLGSSLVAMSVGAALLRQNFWLFGWPLSLLFVWFMKRNRYFVYMLGLIGAEYAYRILVPKTVVSTTGPIYVTEIVPLLALATASGMVELTEALKKKGVHRAGEAVISTTVAGMIVAVFCFWPFQIAGIRSGALMWRTPYTVLTERNVTTAIVFASKMVSPRSGATWAYFPPNPSPSLDDDILFLRIPKTEGSVRRRLVDFWKKQYPDREAFYLKLTDDSTEVVPLAESPPQGKR